MRDRVGGRRLVEADDLPRTFKPSTDAAPSFDAIVSMREMQRRYAGWVLEQVDGIRAHAARRLGIDVKTLGRLLAPHDGSEEPGAG